MAKRSLFKYGNLAYPELEIPIYTDSSLAGEYHSPDLTQIEYLPFAANRDFLNAAVLDISDSAGSQGFSFFQGAYVYDLSLAGGFQLRGKISHNDPDPASADGKYLLQNHWIRRCLYIDQELYILSDNRMFIHALADLKELERYPLYCN